MSLPELSDQARTWYILKGYEIEEEHNGRIYYMDGKFHREDGPAIEHVDGYLGWWWRGKYLTRSQYQKTISMEQK